MWDGPCLKKNLKKKYMSQYSNNRINLEEVLPENTLKTRVPQVSVSREIKPAPGRYLNEISKYIIHRDENKCQLCGTCVNTCQKGVHVLKPGYKLFAKSKDYNCIGPDCEKTGHFCVSKCPTGALKIVINPMMKVLGDNRWTSDIILATWKMAETGDLLPNDADYDFEFGHSDGGFDRLRFKFPEKVSLNINEDEIDIGLELNKREDGRPKVKIDVPWYGGGMSFGSVSNVTQLSKVRAAT